MASQLIPVQFSKIMQSSAYTVFVLDAEEKRFAIYVEPSIGQKIQTHLSEGKSQRPQTHEFIDQIFEGFEIKILQVVIRDLEDTIYFARIFIEQCRENYKQVLEIDARPSDCLTLALMRNIPIFCTRTFLDRVIPLEES